MTNALRQHGMRALALIALAAMLGACGVRHKTTVTRTPAPPATQRAPAPQPPASAPASSANTVRTHTVVSGDTLYQIAKRYGVDFRDIARWNGISEPYTIYPGRKLRLEAPTTTATTATRPPTQASTNSAVASSPATVPANPTKPAVQPEVARPSAAVSTPTTASTSTSGAAASTAGTTPITKTTATEPPLIASSGSKNADGLAWRWPTNGHVVATFAAGDQTRQGIGIAGNSGQPVLAAADGEVVYSGSGLIGYGELVILKHNAVYVSVYGHNRKRLVSEGDKVRAGQPIAEMGRSGATRDMLHFEIRKNGKPVDPMGFLPKR